MQRCAMQTAKSLPLLSDFLRFISDFMKQAGLVSKMGNLAGVAKLIPGMGSQLNAGKIKEVESKMRRQEAMINSMTKKERAQPELLITHPTARSRIVRITKGSGHDFEDGLQFMSEFQKMRTMMSRMQKQMGGKSPDAMDDSEMPEMADAAGIAGNRAARRTAKRGKKRGRGGGGGFG